MVLAKESKIPDAITVRYMIIQAGPVDKWKMDAETQSLFPIDGACVVLDQNSEAFLKKVKTIWPQYDCKSLAAGSITCRNNEIYHSTIEAKSDDLNSLTFDIALKPRVNRADNSVTVDADINQSSETQPMPAANNSDVKLPGFVSSRITTSRRLHIGRTYSLGGTLFQKNTVHGEGPESVVLFAVCALPASSKDKVFSKK